MKKSYNKPAMYIEEFTLQEHIAAGCTAMDMLPTDGEKNFTNQNNCTFDSMGMKYFTNGNSNCMNPLDDVECYQGANFLEGYKFFRS